MTISKLRISLSAASCCSGVIFGIPGMSFNKPPKEPSLLTCFIWSFGVDFVSLSTLARLGARELAYAQDSLMVPPSVANEWAAKLLRKAIPGSSYLDTALREIGRKTGDRMVQIEDQLRSEILDVFKKKLKKKNFIKPLLKAAKLEEKELQEITGEVLPSGFVWVKDAD